MNYRSTKKITLGSTAFRQWNADSHCRYIHGYNLKAKFWFEAEELDDNNWIVDFGGLKKLKNKLEDLFDHKFWICSLDPYRTEFEKLNKEGVLDLRVSETGISIEKFAEICYKEANEFLESSERNIKCYKVEVFEHNRNSAICES